MGYTKPQVIIDLEEYEKLKEDSQSTYDRLQVFRSTNGNTLHRAGDPYIVRWKNEQSGQIIDIGHVYFSHPETAKMFINGTATLTLHRFNEKS